MIVGLIGALDKSKVMHFRPPSTPLTEETFSCGTANIDITDQYKYLGLVLSDHLDFAVTAKHVAKSAGRALGSLIAKSKAYGGLPFECYTKLYNSLILPIIMYGAAVWGTREYSCIESLHNRACRYFLGVRHQQFAVTWDGKHWQHQWLTVTKNWVRLTKMDEGRVNRRVFTWTHGLAQRNKKNWIHRTMKFYRDQHMDHLANINYVFSPTDVEDLSLVLCETNEQVWHAAVNKERAARGPGRNKLRTYSGFKNVFETEPYCMVTMSRSHRSALARFRCGVAPIMLETGRFQRIPEEERICPLCSRAVESEKHVILDCTAHDDIRTLMYEKAVTENDNFNLMNADEKLNFILSANGTSRYTAKACHDILQRRRNLLYRQ